MVSEKLETLDVREEFYRGQLIQIKLPQGWTVAMFLGRSWQGDISVILENDDHPVSYHRGTEIRALPWQKQTDAGNRLLGMLVAAVVTKLDHMTAVEHVKDAEDYEIINTGTDDDPILKRRDSQKRYGPGLTIP